VIEDRTVGTMNALGPEKPVTMKQMLEACNHALGGKARLTWVDADFLDKQGVEDRREMPMWDPKYVGISSFANARAIKAGLTLRPIGDTAKDTLAWLETLPEDQRGTARSSGIKPDKEAKVLAAWKART